jgi:hypothetical protein
MTNNQPTRIQKTIGPHLDADPSVAQLADVPVHVVADRLGHTDPSITLRVYAHVIRQHAAGIADVFAAAVDPDEDAPEEGQDPSSVAPC